MIEKLKILFNLEGEGQPLKGGQNTSILYKDKVLKPFEGDVSFYTKAVDILYKIHSKEYRISKPIKSINDNYIELNHIVTDYLSGYHNDERISDILDCCRLFHNDLEKFEVKHISKALDPWSKAMDVIWRNTPIEGINIKEKQLVDELISYCEPIDDKLQLIHGDFGGNVLFDDNLPPLIIDFSPNIAPKKFPEAIMIVDLIAWANHGLDVISLLRPLSAYISYIKRAIIFRLLAIGYNENCDYNRFKEEWDAYKKIWFKIESAQLRTKL